MARLTQNPGYVETELYRTDPVTEAVPDTDHHEFRQGVDSSVIATQSDTSALIPNIPTADQKAALDGNVTLNAGNPVASLADASGASAAWAVYSFRTAVDAPLDGEAKLNNADPSLATEVKLANLNSNGSNISNLLLKLGANDAIVIQSATDAGELYNYDVTADPVQTGGTGAGGYVTFTVTNFSVTGALSDAETSIVTVLFDGNNTRFLAKASNLSDIASASTSLTNLGGLAVANNLSDVVSVSASRASLSVQSIAEADAKYLDEASNLSDVANAATALSNIGGQPLDADLTAIAAIAGVNGDLMIYNSGWKALAGPAIGQQLGEAAGLPAWVAGSSGGSVTGYIDGLELSNAVDTAHDITVGLGVCRNDADTADYTLAVALTKQIDAAWAEGNNLGGMATGVVANNTWYHVWGITKDSDGTEDVTFDISSTGVNTPALWTAARRLGSVLTDGAANIIQFVQDGDYFQWVAAVSDVAVNNPGIGWDNRTLSTPVGFKCLAQVVMMVEDNGSSNGSASIGNPNQTQSADLRIGNWDTTSSITSSFVQIMTNLSSQVMTNVSASTASVAINVFTRGYIDFRGKR